MSAAYEPGPTRRQVLRGGAGVLSAWSLAIVGMAATARPEPRLAAFVRDARLPAFVTTTSAQSAYLAALSQPDLLGALPCFCGCVGYVPPHRNLRDCFVRPNGTGFDAHAAGCEVCQREALAAVAWHDDGLDPSEVRQRVVDTYGGLGPSTDRAA